MNLKELREKIIEEVTEAVTRDFSTPKYNLDGTPSTYRQEYLVLVRMNGDVECVQRGDNDAWADPKVISIQDGPDLCFSSHSWGGNLAAFGDYAVNILAIRAASDILGAKDTLKKEVARHEGMVKYHTEGLKKAEEALYHFDSYSSVWENF